MTKNLLQRWNQYRYRFVPWIALNLKNRSARKVPDASFDKLLPDKQVKAYLCTFFTALFQGCTTCIGSLQSVAHNNGITSDITMSPSQNNGTNIHSAITEKDFERHICHNDLPVHTLNAPLKTWHVSRLFHQKRDSAESLELLHKKNLVVMKEVLGFTVERQPSRIIGGGNGVVVTNGVIREGTVAAIYPGLVYNSWEPILLQSINNQFVFRCIDNIHVDGNDRGMSRYLYRSCAQRDRLGPYWLCDTSWLTECPVNPLAIGQYVNNHTKQYPANVAYQEVDITEEFPFRLRCYLPNTRYGSSLDGNASKTRSVILVSLRDINEGEELLSSYFTLVQAA